MGTTFGPVILVWFLLLAVLGVINIAHMPGVLRAANPLYAVWFMRDNGVVRIAVRDSGPGIPHDQQRVIFEKFGRADVSGSKPGSGLGLFIARSIVEAHGGTLEVTSRPEQQGATFTLTLPTA